MVNRKSKDMIRVFARRTEFTPTDDLAFFDEPPMWELPELPVCVSVTFSWDIPHGFRLYEAWRRRYRYVYIGGPALTKLPGEFVAGRFLKAGITITSRGCPNRCPFCQVSFTEGAIKELTIEPGYVIQDNNLLACSRGHIERVCEMLKAQRRAAVFAGGLDADLFRPWHVDLFHQIRVKELWFACDHPRDLDRLGRVAELCSGFRLRQKRCYVLMGFDEHDTPAAADRRCEAILGKGFCPFAMLYQPPERRQYSPEWKGVQRKWSRPAAYLSKSEQS